MLFAAVVLIGCGGSDSTGAGGDEDGDDAGIEFPDGLDPCDLADESTLASYFRDAEVSVERGEAGPIVSCSWSDPNANSLLIQTASNYGLYRPDPCDGCVTLTFGDDGYALESPIQSMAEVISGDLWLSVTTTGLGDDSASIADLLERVFESATA
jgi:hypothetical protein